MDKVRVAVAAALVWYALGAPGLPPNIAPSAGYSGSLSELHTAAGEMESSDRAGLSGSLGAAADMLEKDPARLITDTASLQRFTRGVIGFGYSSFSVKKYPRVADEVQKQLETVVGEASEALTDEKRRATVAALREMSEATK